MLRLNPRIVTRRSGIASLHGRCRVHRAQYAIGEIDEADDDVIRRKIAPACFEQGGALRDLGKNEGGQADETAPHHPAQALIVLGCEAPSPREQDADRREIDRDA